tara:strand:+ start:16783 stop:17676 length:894 start_codon:yes stop_codon:yes gene_type:complete
MEIQIKDLSVLFEGMTVLEIESLCIPSSQFCSCVDLDGTGASTLLQVIVGKVPYDEGTIQFDKQVVNVPKLEDSAVHFVSRLADTSYERNREVSLLVCDRSFLGSDRTKQVQICEQVRKLQGCCSLTVLYATREPQALLEYSDQIIFFDGGRIVQSGTPENCFDNPQTLSVASFFGPLSMNLVPAVLEKDGCAIQVGPRSIQLPGEIADAYCRDVTLGIRPECLRLRCEPGIGWPGRVVSMEMKSDATYVSVAVDGAVFLVRCPDRELVSLGQFVGIHVQAEALHLFDEQGNRLSPE